MDLPITLDETNAGLTPPAVAYALLGKGGSILVIIIVFMVCARLICPLCACTHVEPISLPPLHVHMLSWRSDFTLHRDLRAAVGGCTQAVTSSGSAEQIAVSSLITYDLYKTYINPKATPKQLILVRIAPSAQPLWFHGMRSWPAIT
jgi:hypothetical protein